MITYNGSRHTVKIFTANLTGYLTDFNTVLQNYANETFTSAPINGGTEIQAASITGDRLVDGTITSAKLAAAITIATIANNTFLKFRNNANNADLNGIKVTTADLLSHGINWDALTLANQKTLGGTTVGGAGQNWMQTDASDHWKAMNTFYPQHLFPQTDNTYDSGGASNKWANVRTNNLIFQNGGTAMNWYEQGTFTPTATGLTVAGTTTYSTQVGRFTRIGNIVFYVISVIWTGFTGTGGIKIGGFPYTPNASGVHYDPVVAAGSPLSGSSDSQLALQIGGTNAIYSTFANNAVSPVLTAVAAAGNMSISGKFEV